MNPSPTLLLAQLYFLMERLTCCLRRKSWKLWACISVSFWSSVRQCLQSSQLRQQQYCLRSCLLSTVNRGQLRMSLSLDCSSTQKSGYLIEITLVFSVETIEQLSGISLSVSVAHRIAPSPTVFIRKFTLKVQLPSAGSLTRYSKSSSQQPSRFCALVWTSRQTLPSCANSTCFCRASSPSVTTCMWQGATPSRTSTSAGPRTRSSAFWHSLLNSSKESLLKKAMASSLLRMQSLAAASKLSLAFLTQMLWTLSSLTRLMALRWVSPSSKSKTSRSRMERSMKLCSSMEQICFWILHLPRMMMMEQDQTTSLRLWVMVAPGSYSTYSRGGTFLSGQRLKGCSLLRMARVCQSVTLSWRESRYLSSSAIFSYQIDTEGSINLDNFNMQLGHQTMQGTPSPSKRSTFRSKTKLKDLASTLDSKLRTMPLFYVYVKDFPLDIPEDVIALVRTLEPAHNNFLEHLENLRLYKPQLSSLLEDSWAESMQILRAVIVKLSKRSDKVIEEKEHKISELLRMNRELEREQQRWSERVDKLEHLRELESVQLSMADTELDIVNGEMRDIYKLLQGDMQKVSSYLTRLEARKAQEDEEGSDQINGSLKTLSILLNSMENEQRSAGNSLGNMRELIKSMTKCSKVTTGTQVDESELLTQAGAIFANCSPELLPFPQAEAAAVALASSQPHLIDQLKLRERSQPHESFSLAKHAEKPWALTPTLLAFLENMSKDNEAGKVLPWEYTKQLMADIIAQRNALQGELMAGGIGNGMLFDEFVVFYFLQKHRIRRLAEVKLLEFMISLKYYSRYWQRAQLFCQLMEVMRYQPLFENPEGFNYRLDYNAQNFFLSIHRKLATFDCVEEEGATYVDKKSAKKLLKICLYFTEEYQRSRLLAKLDKDLRVFDKVEYCDFDWAMALMLDEYLASKKRITATLNRAFSKKYEENQGFFSIDELKELFAELTPVYRAGESLQYGFPVASEVQIGKLYLYACTSGKNTYELNVNSFIAACQRYGFDAPFPFLHTCRKQKREEPQEERAAESAKTTSTRKEPVPALQNEEISLTLSLDNPKTEASLNKERIDIGAKIFSQHFSILRQLKLYVDIFSKTLREEKSAEVLWKSFQQVRQVLQKGCEFMRYPLHDARQ